MNALAHRIAGGSTARLFTVSVVTRPPRAVVLLATSMLCTTASMAVLARLATRIG